MKIWVLIGALWHYGKLKPLKKLPPHPTSDAQAKRFDDASDLSQFALKAMKPHRFEFIKKSKQVNM